MDDDLMKVFINPKTGKILLEIVRKQRITVKELCERFADIPRSTMYRILTKMERSGYIKVVDRHQIRGVVEKTYAPSDDIMNMKSMPDFSLDDLADMFVRYAVEFLTIFRDYADQNKGRPVEELKNDLWGFYTAPVYVNSRDLEHIISDIGAIFTHYTKENWAEGRTLRSIGTIITPPVRSD